MLSVVERLGKKQDIILVLLFAGLAYLSIYYIYPSRPGYNPFMDCCANLGGWQSWYDQGHYYDESTAILKGTFSAEKFYYGVGYPAVSVPFSLISPEHRFLIPDLAMYLAIIYMTYQLTLNFSGGRRYAFMSVLLLMFLTNYTYYFEEPWIDHVTDFSIMVVFFLLFRDIHSIDMRSGMLAGIAIGWDFASRYLDAIFLLLMPLVLILCRPKKILFFYPAVIVVILVLLLHQSMFGDFLKPPLQYPLTQPVGQKLFSFDPAILLQRTYCITISPMACVPATGDATTQHWWYRSLIDKTPMIASTSAFFVLAPVGYWQVIQRYEGYQRYILLSLLLSFSAEAIFYLAFNSWDSGWTRFFRYHELWFPMLTIQSTLGLKFMIEKFKPWIFVTRK